MHITIAHNEAGVGDTLSQIDFAYSLATHLGLPYVHSRMVTRLHGLDLNEQLGLHEHGGLASMRSCSASIRDLVSLPATAAAFASAFAGIELLRVVQTYDVEDPYAALGIIRKNFAYAQAFCAAHGTLAADPALAVIHLRMGDARAYKVSSGFFSPMLRGFCDPDRDLSHWPQWQVSDVARLVEHLQGQGKHVVILCDGYQSALNAVAWSNLDPAIDKDRLIADITRSAEADLKLLNSLGCAVVREAGKVVEAVRAIMQASMVVVTGGSFARGIAYRYVEGRPIRICSIDEALGELG